MGTGTELGRVRGLGSAHHGTGHWLQQRLTAIANFALIAWLVMSFLMLPMTDYQAVTTWLKSPLVAVPLILLVLSVFWHARLGLQVVIEDYCQGGARLLALVALNFFVVAGAALALFCIVKIAIAGVAG